MKKDYKKRNMSRVLCEALCNGLKNERVMA